ncbi:MAG: hypothetical protein HY722_00275 [Planctomycetes bacterium]|nr:hypothetical protein [Planctomycetota bacterium]
MYRKAVAAGSLAAALAWAPARARSQERPPEPPREPEVPLSVVFLRETRAVRLDVAGAAPYPDGAIVFLALAYKGEKDVIHWHRAEVKGGRFQLVVGPYEKRLLSGTYVLEAHFMLGQQPMFIQDALRGARGVDVEFQEVVGSVEVAFGDELQTAREDREVVQRFLEYMGGLEAVFRQVEEAREVFEAPPKDGSPARMTPERAARWEQSQMDRSREIAAQGHEFQKWLDLFVHMRHADWVHELDGISLELANLDGAYARRYAVEAAIPDPSTRPDPAADAKGAAKWDTDQAFARLYLDSARNQEEKSRYLLTRRFENYRSLFEGYLAGLQETIRAAGGD